MTDTKIAAAHRAATEALTAAQHTLAGLVRDKHAATARQRELDQERRRLAFAGLTGGSAKDRAALAEISAESLKLSIDIDNIGHAISTAEEHVTAARRALERAKVRARASGTRAYVAKMQQAGERCGAGLDAFLSAYDEVIASGDAIRQTGIGRWPRAEVLEGAVRRSLQAALARRHLNTEPLLVAPANRRELDEVIGNFVRELEISIDREIGEPETEAAE